MNRPLILASISWLFIAATSDGGGGDTPSNKSNATMCADTGFCTSSCGDQRVVTYFFNFSCSSWAQLPSRRGTHESEALAIRLRLHVPLQFKITRLRRLSRAALQWQSIAPQLRSLTSAEDLELAIRPSLCLIQAWGQLYTSIVSIHVHQTCIDKKRQLIGRVWRLVSPSAFLSIFSNNRCASPTSL